MENGCGYWSKQKSDKDLNVEYMPVKPTGLQLDLLYKAMLDQSKTFVFLLTYW